MQTLLQLQRYNNKPQKANITGIQWGIHFESFNDIKDLKDFNDFNNLNDFNDLKNLKAPKDLKSHTKNPLKKNSSRELCLKEGGYLLSRIALQYHRRKWA